MKHIVMFSGGISSWAVAQRVIAKHGKEGATLLFADTLMEDDDLYRFIDETAAHLGVPILKITEGRTPWEVFHDVRFLGNTRIDPCSRVLKREPLRKWLEDNCKPEDTIVYLGFDWTELHRVARAEKFWAPWKVENPLTEKPLTDKDTLIKELKSYGIEPPRLYKMGFPHNNCGGFCIKAGQAHFRHLLLQMPERYKYHEEQEEKIREYLDADVAIMRDRTGGQVTPLTMKALRERIENKGQCDLFEWGGCGCFDSNEED